MKISARSNLIRTSFELAFRVTQTSFESYKFRSVYIIRFNKSFMTLQIFFEILIRLVSDSSHGSARRLICESFPLARIKFCNFHFFMLRSFYNPSQFHIIMIYLGYNSTKVMHRIVELMRFFLYNKEKVISIIALRESDLVHRGK